MFGPDNRGSRDCGKDKTYEPTMQGPASQARGLTMRVNLRGPQPMKE